MIVGSIGSLMLPILVGIEYWYQHWQHLDVSAGSLTPEVIPEGVLWVDNESVLIINLDGDYLGV